MHFHNRSILAHGGSGGGLQACTMPQPRRIRRAASGRGVEAPQRATSTESTTPLLHVAVSLLVPSWPAFALGWKAVGRPQRRRQQLNRVHSGGGSSHAAGMHTPSQLTRILETSDALDPARCHHKLPACARAAPRWALQQGGSRLGSLKRNGQNQGKACMQGMAPRALHPNAHRGGGSSAAQRQAGCSWVGVGLSAGASKSNCCYVCGAACRQGRLR